MSQKNKIPILFKNLGIQDYESILHKMQNFTKNRDTNTTDEVWFMEHKPVYTYGARTKKEDIPSFENIPSIKTDRGGQITFHGPGQLIVYMLFDLKRRSLGMRDFIGNFEEVILKVIQAYKVDAFLNINEPGVFIKERKIVNFGLKISRGFSYHGASINISMDMNPWRDINICGNDEIKASDLNKMGVNCTIDDIRLSIEKNILMNF